MYVPEKKKIVKGKKEKKKNYSLVILLYFVRLCSLCP